MKGVVGAVVVLSGVLLVSASASSVAASAIEIGPDAVAVQFAPQELTTPVGIARLYQRLRLAADQVCLPYESILLQRERARDRCVQESLARAVEDVGDARLTAYSLHWLPERSPLAQAPARAARRS